MLFLSLKTLGVTTILPYLEYITAFESKLRSTCCNLLLSNFANEGITFWQSICSSITKFLKLRVVFINSIISLIDVSSEPDVIFRVNLPFSMIFWSRRSFAWSSTILQETMIMFNIFFAFSLLCRIRRSLWQIYMFARSGASISWCTVVLIVFSNSLFYYSFFSLMYAVMSIKFTTWHSFSWIII